MKDIIKSLGQFFIIGFPDNSPSLEFLNFIDEVQPGGVILFENNCNTYESTARNILSIKSRYNEYAPFIAIDQEGGRVCRLRGTPVEYMSPMKYAKYNDLEKFIEDYSRSTMYMESLGINLNLAPVADVYINPKNEVLKDRCFGTTPAQVSLFVEAAIGVAKKSSMLSCLKHFPGLGGVEIDPHKQTSIADFDKIIWDQREKIPFDAGVKKGAEFIMTTHVKLPQIDNEIVTVSKKIIDELIRENLSFDGLVITDDLCMEGANEIGDYGERAVKAFNAGHDILLFGQKFEIAIEAYEYFVNAVERGEISEQRLDDALSRISGTKFKLERSVMN
ncbi:MAG: glycoside hydrolase family 3 N-terminal domain-containing protein [candidate division Zixibacteria bacterium]|nr:glycoside hydrolase family 3 N-terminal domain-containing protein [candidate division Zixibacteria bacterium]